MAAVLEKEKAREAAEREKNILEQQKLQALQAVNTAEADKQAAQLRADGQAYAVKVQAAADAEALRLMGDAEAGKIAAVNRALANSPLLVEYEKAKSWDGKLPSVSAGNSAFLMDIGGKP
ncbi:MAG: hypothetical protein LRY54_04160 [Alphaproteobacteria bacterium]|nr:hypothetical protein [Alphaproteobacteria bacterium]